jgi:uncharacterized protein (DUF4415 family)
MKPEYDFKKMKVKRRGVLPAMRTKKEDHTKVRITISLDKEVVDYFKSKAKTPGEFPYQTQINQKLRHLMAQPDSTPDNFLKIKKTLLNDDVFINEIVKRVGQRNFKKT